ncbi:MAG: hypothetical protein IJ874_06150 [Ruminococcus sp.]|nr:hypothetical protein [Ruminococcus sp.]
MAFWNRKKNQDSEKNTEITESAEGIQAADGDQQQIDTGHAKELALEALNKKLNGTIYDNCIITRRGGYTIDINVTRPQEKEGTVLAQIVYIVRNDSFDEPIIEPCDVQGKTWEEAADMGAQMFDVTVWHSLEMAAQRKNPQPVSVDFLNQHYDFDLFSESVLRVNVSQEKPVTSLFSYIKEDIPKYLGSKKYYWVRLFAAAFNGKRISEVRVNGSVCMELSNKLRKYVDTLEAGETYISEKQCVICVQKEDDKCPFTKETVTTAAKAAIDMMVGIRNPADYEAMSLKLIDIAGDKDLASEIRIFVPEILAKLTLGYREGDSLFFIDGDSQIEFRKTQLRSYFYIQQVLLEFLSRRPPQEDVQNIVFNSVAFREMKKTIDAAKEKGQEIKPQDMYVPGTSYKIVSETYRVW